MSLNLAGLQKPAFGDLFESAIFSDGTIQVDGRTFAVHRCILASSSKYFEKAFGGEFKEASGNLVITCEQDDNEDRHTCEAMLRFCYGWKFKDLYDACTGTDMTVFGPKLYGLADKYQISGLKEEITKTWLNPTLVNAIVGISDLTPVVQAVYGLTPPSDRGLRDLVLKIISQKPGLLAEQPKHEDLNVLFTENDGFAADVFQAMMKAVSEEAGSHWCRVCASYVGYFRSISSGDSFWPQCGALIGYDCGLFGR